MLNKERRSKKCEIEPNSDLIFSYGRIRINYKAKDTVQYEYTK